MNINTVFIRSINGIADGAEYLVKHTGGIVIPTTLGALGGCLVGVGTSLGAFQGFIGGTLHSLLISPISRYVDQNAGEQPDQIHQNARCFLKTVGIVSGVALSILVTANYGDALLRKSASLLPNFCSSPLTFSHPEKYSPLQGAFIEILYCHQ